MDANSNKKAGGKLIIDQTKVAGFIEHTSSFAFEMKVVKELRELGMKVSHSANYSDPVTGLTRQYDIRTSFTKGQRSIALSVECKNVSEDHPLIVSCSPRLHEEGWHSVFRGTIGGDNADTVRYSSIYRSNQMVGRAIEQYSSDFSKVKPRDEYYPKFSQSIQSAVANLGNWKEELASLSMNPGSKVLVIPCLVVPDGLLWVATYDEDGKLTGEPSQEDYISMFIGFDSAYRPSPDAKIYHYAFSHVELMTFSGIKKLWVEHLRAAGADLRHLFEN